MSTKLWSIGRVAAICVLLLILAGLLLAYAVTGLNLPARIYTAAQVDYLNYNAARVISQLPPTVNYLGTDGRYEMAMQFQRSSRVRAVLKARYEEQEGVSVTVYDLAFEGEYVLAYPGPGTAAVQLVFPFPGNLETLHEVSFLVDGEQVPAAQYNLQGISWEAVLGAGEEHRVSVSYQADGASSFSYGLVQGQRTDVDVSVVVQGLTGSQAPRTSLPTTLVEPAEGGEAFHWNYSGLIADRNVQLTLPARLSFAQRVAQFQDSFRAMAVLSPVMVGLFLVALAGMLHLGGVHLRLESYLMAGCGLALFYPGLTFGSGMVGVVPAAVLAFGIIGALLLAFLGRAAGWKKVTGPALLLLVVFLGLFSLGLLTPWRGLFLTGGGIVLVGAFMLVYARRPAVQPAQPTVPPAEMAGVPTVQPLQPAVPPDETAGDPADTSLPAEKTSEETLTRYCPYCARPLDDDYAFCPSCGHDTDALHRCERCGHEQVVPEGQKVAYCVQCGQRLE